MDDIEGWPQATGERIGREDPGPWTVTLTPDGVRIDGPGRVANLALGAVRVVRQYPAVALGGQVPASVFELEWVTALGEERTLALRCEDQPSAERLARVIERTLRELDELGGPGRRRIDWVLVVLFATSTVLGVSNFVDALPLTNAYDWTAAVANLVIEVAGIPLLFVLVRGLVRWDRRRRAGV